MHMQLKIASKLCDFLAYFRYVHERKTRVYLQCKIIFRYKPTDTSSTKRNLFANKSPKKKRHPEPESAFY